MSAPPANHPAKQVPGSDVPVEIRVLHAGDDAVLGRVAPDVFDHEVNPAWAAEFLRDPRHHLVVAIDAGVVIGFVSAIDYVHPDKPAQLFINEVGVAPSHQRRGIGRKLMAAMFDVGRSLGCREAWVGTEHDNTGARRLYASLKESRPPEDFVLFEFKL